MLQSYEAMYENGQITWVDDRPSMKSARLIVTVLEEIPQTVKRRVTSVSIAGKGKTLGDIVSPIVHPEI